MRSLSLRSGDAGCQARRRRLLRKQMSLLLLMFPGLLLIFLFRYLPMAGTLLAFKDFKVKLGIFGSPWVNFKWFRELFSNPQFVNVLWNTICLSLLKILISFPAPILLALMLNEVRKEKIKKPIQTLLYLPHFLSWTVLAGILNTLLSPSVGVAGLFGLTRNPLLDTALIRPLIIATDIWKEAGWGTIIYLAAMTGIGQELYEAATTDGANRMQKLWHITLPGIAATIAIMFILRTGSVLSVGFDQIYNLQKPVTMDVTDVLDTFVYRYGLAQGRYAFATAAGLFQSAVGLLLVLMSNFVSKRVQGSGIW